MRIATVAAALLSTAAFAQDSAQLIENSRKRWADSPHGPMLERILPPTFEVSQLPSPKSRGAKLMVQYCVQCHNLPNPAMHEAKKWPAVFDRMVVRMRGKGNMGELMKEMMAGVQAPSDEEVTILLDYLRRNGQRPLDQAKYPEVNRPEGQSFKLACQQCH